MRSLFELIKLNVGAPTTDEENIEYKKLESAVISARKVISEPMNNLVDICAIAIDSYKSNRK